MSDSWHGYPKVYGLGHPAIRDLFDDDVIAEEKIDGSQFSFGRFGDQLRAKSHHKELVLDAVEKMFQPAVETVQRLAPSLHDGWTYRGEVVARPKHNVLKYDRIPSGAIILFDVNIGLEEYLGYDEKQSEAARLGLEVVPLVYRGKVDSKEQAQSLIDRDSVLGACKVEGVVFKNYRRFGTDSKAKMGKWVSESFREVAVGEFRKANPTKTDIMETLLEQYRTEARWGKAVQRLRENGALAGDPRDIGALIKAVQADIDDECRAEIADRLAAWAMPQIKRAAVAGLPEWYKAALFDDQFAGSGQ